MMSGRETEEYAKHGEILRWIPTQHYVSTGLPCCISFLFCSLVILHLTLLFIDDAARGGQHAHCHCRGITYGLWLPGDGTARGRRIDWRPQTMQNKAVLLPGYWVIT
jgi:hypothetical protein